MAKSGPNTVTSQWFINQGNNSFLDNPARPDGGFSAFGAVLGNGMVVVDAIGDLPVPNDFGFGITPPFNDLPLRDFSGTSIHDIRVRHTVTVLQVSVLNLPAGDYDLNGTVNSLDYTLWKSTLGSRTNASADGNGNGIIDTADYVVWRKTLGQSTGSGGTLARGIPEPTAVLLLAPGVLLLSVQRHWLRQRCLRW